MQKACADCLNINFPLVPANEKGEKTTTLLGNFRKYSNNKNTKKCQNNSMSP